MIHYFRYLDLLLTLLSLFSSPVATVCSCKTGLSGTGHIVKFILVCYTLDCGKIVVIVRLCVHAKLGSVALVMFFGFSRYVALILMFRLS